MVINNPETALDSPDKVVAELGEAGFRSMEIHRLSHDVVVHDVAGVWREMVEGSAHLGLVREGMSQDEWDHREASAIRHLVDNYSSPISVAMPAIVGIGHKP